MKSDDAAFIQWYENEFHLPYSAQDPDLMTFRSAFNAGQLHGMHWNRESVPKMVVYRSRSSRIHLNRSCSGAGPTVRDRLTADEFARALKCRCILAISFSPGNE